jgi:hypothetical protein
LKETAKILHYHWRKLLIHQWKPCQYQTVGGWQI